MSTGYSGRVWACPFFQWDERRGIHCEGGGVSFEDRETFGRYATRHCCDVDGWDKCSLAQALVERYERREAKRNGGGTP